ncbi:MAG: hypothetical protein R3D26_07920 [Cyanobacteriota/Melainabacteria group bacterium]
MEEIVGYIERLRKALSNQNKFTGKATGRFCRSTYSFAGLLVVGMLVLFSPAGYFPQFNQLIKLPFLHYFSEETDQKSKKKKSSFFSIERNRL